MPDEKTFATPILGLNTDDDPSNLSPGEYTYMMGGTLNTTDGTSPFRENMDSFVVAGFIPEGYIIIGRCLLDNNELVLLLASLNGNSEIGSYKDKKYTTKVNYRGFNFTIYSQIKVKYKRLSNGNRIIYFVEDNNPPRYMNFDKPNYIKTLDSNNCLVEDKTQLDLDDMQIFRNYYNPCIRIIDTPETGGIPACGLFISTQYANVLGNELTAWTNPVGPVAIFKDSLSKTRDYIAGDKSEAVTTKAVRISIEDPDLSFTHLNIAVIKVINGVRSAFKVATIPVGSGEYTYTGIGNTETIIAVDEIIQPAISYNRAGTIETTDKELLLGDVWKEKEFNYQPYVSRIQVQWQVFKAWSDDKQMTFNNPVFSTYMRVFRQDEVYALALELDTIDGTTTRSYHIPGRKLDHSCDGEMIKEQPDAFGNVIPAGSWDSYQGFSNADIIDPVRNLRHQVYNTAYISGNSSSGTDIGLAEYGEMGFYESLRTYPCDKLVWGEDAGKPIRHHMFPDSTVIHIHDGEGSNRGFTDRVKLNYIGIRLPNIDDIIGELPTNIRLKIKRWRIVIGDRTYSKSVIASGLIFNARRQNWKNNKDDKDDKRLYPNYPLNDLRPDPYIYNAEKIFGAVNPFLLPISSPDEWHTDYLKDSFFFHSPDTHFKKSYLSATELKVNAEMYGKTVSRFDWVEPYPDFNEKSSDNDRAAIQGTSVANYNNYNSIPQGEVIKALKDALYIPFNSKVSGGQAGLPVWNVYRESSVLLSIEKAIPDPSVQDTSRFILINEPDGVPSTEQLNCNILKEVTRSASAYYVSLKRKVDDQYGGIEDVKYVDTYTCGPEWLPGNVIFGGDTFLGSFSMKLQNIMYQNIKQFIGADDGLTGADFKPSSTIAHPIYFYRNKSGGGKPRNQSVTLCKDNSGAGLFGLFGDGDATALGYLVMAMYGIPNFWVEADNNIELRYPGDISSQSFYPNLNDGSFRLEDWLSVKNIDTDNVFNVNQDYNAKNQFKVHEINDLYYDPNNTADVHFDTRTVYSLESTPGDIYDNWMVFKALNYYDLPKNRGRLQDINYLGNYKTMFRTESAIFIDTLYKNLESSDGQVFLGGGKLFERAPEEVAYTNAGYGGGGSKWAFDNTPFGALFASSRFGSVFQLSGKLDEVSNNKMCKWFDENLRFKLLEQVPSVPHDNPANSQGIGLLSVYDMRNKLWLLTKKDYEIINSDDVPLITYKEGSLYRNGNKVNVNDNKIFINKSWTMLYNPVTQRWISWEPFLPNAYMFTENKVLSFVNESSKIWKHNEGEGSVQNFYGLHYPFIIETLNKKDGVNQFVNPAISFMTQATDKNKRIQERITFNKVIIWNTLQCSGERIILVQDEDDLASLYKIIDEPNIIVARYRKGMFNISDYYDAYKHENEPFFTTDNCFPYDKVINPLTIDYDTPFVNQALFREKWIKTRFIFDNKNDVKLLVKLTTVLNREPAF